MSDYTMACRADLGGCGAAPGKPCADDCAQLAAVNAQPTMMQATATGLAMLALREKGFTVDEEDPTQLRITSPDGQAFTLRVLRRVADR